MSRASFLPGSSLRCVAGLEEVLDESCGGDVEDELLSEFDDNPGTTRGTKFSVLHNISSLFRSIVEFHRFFHSYEHPCSEQSFPSDRTASV